MVQCLPEALEQLQVDYQQQWTALGQQLLARQPFDFDDRRFASGNWSEPLFGSMAAFYLLNSGFLLKLLELLTIKEEKPRQRLRYLIEQAIAASAPSNFLLSNPDALKCLVETQGPACSVVYCIWPETYKKASCVNATEATSKLA